MPVITELLARLGVDSRNFDSQLRDAEKKLRRQATAVESISKKLSIGVNAIIAGAGVRAVIRTTDAYTVLQNRLRAVTDSQEELARVQERLFQVSRDTRSSVEANVELFSRLSLSTKELGVSESELIDFTKSLNQAIKLSGATATEAQAGIIQLAQGMASGALRGDELRSVLEQLPAVADVIAKSLGVTRGRLREMGSEGQITAEVILKAFREARGELADRFGSTIPTIAEGFTQLRNSLIQLGGAFSQATGFGDSFGEALDKIGRRIETLANRIRESGVISLLGRVLNPGGQATVDPLKDAREKGLKDFGARFQEGRGGEKNSVQTFFQAQEFMTGQGGILSQAFSGLSQGFDTLKQKSAETFSAMSQAGISFLLNAGEPINAFLTQQIPSGLSVAQETWIAAFQHVADTTVAMTNIAAGAMQSFFHGFATALVQAITKTAEFGEAFLNIFVNVLGQLLTSLISFVLEVVALKIAQIVFNVAADESKKGIGGVIAAIIAIPILIGALIALSAAQRKRSKEIVGMDTGGLVTADGMALLHSGEVVATPDEVKDAMSGDRDGFTFNLLLDGRLVARSILPHIPREIRMRGV